jgi:hypothetical protein
VTQTWPLPLTSCTIFQNYWIWKCRWQYLLDWVKQAIIAITLEMFQQKGWEESLNIPMEPSGDGGVSRTQSCRRGLILCKPQNEVTQHKYDIKAGLHARCAVWAFTDNAV